LPLASVEVEEATGLDPLALTSRAVQSLSDAVHDFRG
jgi:hypothetical protein